MSRRERRNALIRLELAYAVAVPGAVLVCHVFVQAILQILS